MFVLRNAEGTIFAISKITDSSFHESVADDAVELIAFIQSAKSTEQLALEQTDQTMARVMEDVVNLLVEQGVIRFTDLPDAAQDKLLNRRELRGKRQGIDLLDDGDNLHL
jgi:predicted RNA-binding protein